MPLHTQVDASVQDDELDVNPVYVQELGAGIPRYRLPAHGVLPRTALQMVRDELILDGNARLNLATFVTTWMEPEAEQLMAECAAKNMIDKDEYPQTAELEQRCVNILSHLWNAPAGSEATGCSTTGSSEACMLGGMALLWRWRARRQAAGQDAARPNLVMGSNVQVCWEKFCRYWQVEPRFVPMVPGRLHLRGAEAAAQCDENTIGVVAIMGSTMDGSYEPVLEISQALDRVQTEQGHDVARREGSSPRSCSPNWSGISGFRGWRPSTPRATSTAWYIPGSAGSCGGRRTPCPRISSSRSTT
jgi:glutamate decarboxylase